MTGNPRPWNALIDDWKVLDGHRVQDMEYVQFPSLIARSRLAGGRMSLNGCEVEDLRYKEELVLAISLLGEFYTLFLERSFDFRDASGRTGPQLRVLQQPGAAGEAVKEIVGQHFPAHRFIAHPLIFSTTLAHSPLYGESWQYPPGPHQLYLYLFDNTYPADYAQLF